MADPYYRCHYCKRGWDNWTQVPHWTSSRPKKAYCVSCAFEYLELHVLVPVGAPPEPPIPAPSAINVAAPMMLRNTPEPTQPQGFPGVEGVPHNPYAIATVSPPARTCELNEVLRRYAASHGMGNSEVIKLPLDMVEELQREKKQQPRWEDKSWNPPWPCTGLCGAVFLSETPDLCWSKSKPRKPWCSLCNTLNTVGPAPQHAITMGPSAEAPSSMPTTPIMQRSYQPNGAVPSSSSTAVPNPQLVAPTGPPPPVPHGIPHAPARETLPSRPGPPQATSMPSNENVPAHVRIRDTPAPPAPPSPPTRTFPTPLSAPSTTERSSPAPPRPNPPTPSGMLMSNLSPSPPQAFSVVEQQFAPGAPTAREQRAAQDPADAMQQSFVRLQLDEVNPPHAKQRLASGSSSMLPQPIASQTVNVQEPRCAEQYIMPATPYPQKPASLQEQHSAFVPANASGSPHVPTHSSAWQPPSAQEPPVAPLPVYEGFVHAVPDEIINDEPYAEWTARVAQTWEIESSLTSGESLDIYMRIREGELIRIVAQDPTDTDFKQCWLHGFKESDGSAGWFPGDWVERADQ